MEKLKISSLTSVTIEDLGKTVDTNDSFKYGHLWELIGANPETLDFIKKFTRTPFINELLDESRKEPAAKSSDSSDGMEQIEIYYMIEKWDNDLSCSWEIHGIGYEEGHFEKYGLDFSSLNSLKDYDVLFCKKVILLNVAEDEEETDTNFISINAAPSPTLLEVFDTVIFDATFYGQPANRESELRGLKSRIDDIDSGNVKMIPMDEAFQSVKDKLEARIKDYENGM